MTSKKAPKSKTLLMIQLVIGIVAVIWFSYDFFHTIFNGRTYTLRFDSQLHFGDNALAFFIAVLIKLGVFGFFVWLIRDCLRGLKSHQQ